MAVSKVLSIEITDMTTHVCEIGYNKRNPVIYKSIIFDNPQYSVEDGFVMNRGVYGSVLKEQLTSAKIKTKDTVFSLASSKIINREVTIPEMKPDMIAGLIENERSEYFPMDTAGHFFAFDILEKMKESKQQRIMIYAAPEILVKNMTALAAELDLNIVAMDYTGNAIYQWLKRPTHEPMEMYLQVNEKNSQFTILDNGLLELQRNMSFGVNTLVSSMNNSRYYGSTELEYTEALLKLKQEKLIFSSFQESDELSPETEEERKLIFLKRQLTDAARPLIGNLSSVLEYYNTKKRGAIMRGANPADARRGAAGPGGISESRAEDINAPSSSSGAASSGEQRPSGSTSAEGSSSALAKIYLGGAGTYVQGLKELIENEFNGIEVVVLDKLPGLNIAKGNMTAQEHSTELIACIGAAYPTISFYQKSAKETLSKTLILSIISLVIVSAAAVLIILNGKSEYDKAVSKQQNLTRQKEALEAGGIEELEAEYGAAVERLTRVKEVDANTFNHNENWNQILRYLENQSVSSMTVSSLTSTESALTMNVVVGSKEDAAKLLLQMQEIPYFESVVISSISENTDEEMGLRIVSFSLTCTYKRPDIEAEGKEE